MDHELLQQTIKCGERLPKTNIGRPVSRNEFWTLVKQYRNEGPYTSLIGPTFDDLCQQNVFPKDLQYERVFYSGHDHVFIKGDYNKIEHKYTCKKYFPNRFEEALTWDGDRLLREIVSVILKD
jgi:hypothetical protein